MEKMSQRIFDKRKELGLTMEELGEKSGVSKSTINKWEKGQIGSIKSQNITALANALSVSPLWLMGIEDDTTYSDNLVSYLTPKFPKVDAGSSQSLTSIEDVEHRLSFATLEELERIALYVEYQKCVRVNHSED
jgi:transcriptional regulator with XRE-family HTH domain